MGTKAYILSGRLIQLIEVHQEEITNRIIHEMRCRRDLHHFRKLQDADLRDGSRQILADLGQWLAREKEEELPKQYELIGKARFAESIPLHESVRALVITKDKMIEFVREQGLMEDSFELYVELYAEEELEHHVGRFFDDLVIHLVHGYEAAWQHAAA
jgi:hypothetical protein